MTDGNVPACQDAACNARARGGARKIRPLCPHEMAAWIAQRARIAERSAP